MMQSEIMRTCKSHWNTKEQPVSNEKGCYRGSRLLSWKQCSLTYAPERAVSWKQCSLTYAPERALLWAGSSVPSHMLLRELCCELEAVFYYLREFSCELEVFSVSCDHNRTWGSLALSWKQCSLVKLWAVPLPERV
jgi:hypothetical protein